MSLGIYTDAGDKTCQGCPGSRGYEQIDLTTFVRDFGAKYIKVDRCFAVDSETMIEDLPETFAYSWAMPRVLGDVEVQLFPYSCRNRKCMGLGR